MEAVRRGLAASLRARPVAFAIVAAVVVGAVSPPAARTALFGHESSGHRIIVLEMQSPRSSGMEAGVETERWTPPPADDNLFDRLEAQEDLSLESRAAGGLTNGELALVIIFLIILFPVGIILLIVFLVT